MSLTKGSGPFSPHPSGHLNFPLAEVAPKHQLLFQPDPRRLRAVIGDVVVLDTTRAHLLYETAIVPRVYAPLEDFRQDLLEPTRTSTHCPFKGDASYLRLAGEGLEVDDLVWHYDTPHDDALFLKGFGAPYPEKVDAWFVEEDRVIGELRDPYHRVDAHPSSRPVSVLVGGTEVARSLRPVLVFETGAPLRAYVPPADVLHPAVVAPGSGKRTICPYKGEATYWTIAGVQDAAWSYDLPLPDALRAQGHLCFDDALDEVEVRLG